MLNLIKLMAVMALATFSASVVAFPSTQLEGDGVIWTLSGDTLDNVGTFTLFADVSGADSPLHDDAYLHEFSLKNFGSNAAMSDLSLTGWNSVNQGLAAKGCKVKVTGTYDALCAFNDTGDFTLGPRIGDGDFSIGFTVTLDIDDLFPALTHFKVRWVESDGDGGYTKVGDLISDDFRTVHEPGIIGLLAIGLLGMVVARRILKA